MRWRKLGLLYAPDGSQAWARSHAMMPTPLHLTDDVVRLYVAHLSAENEGSIAFVDVSLADPMRIVARSDGAVLSPGPDGAFDVNGVVPTCAIAADDGVRLYYSGFQRLERVPYTIFSSIARGDGERFARVPGPASLGPVKGETCFRAAPFVMRDGGMWRMWYIGGDSWVEGPGGKRLPYYSLRHTVSADGLVWDAPSVECFAPRGDEIGFGRPFLVRHRDEYFLWYSIRRRAGYSMGFARSRDGLNWTRHDNDVGIACSPDGWDSEMICYSAVLPRPGGGWVMVYNGNGYGRTGMGVAVSDDEPGA